MAEKLGGGGSNWRAGMQLLHEQAIPHIMAGDL